jgi:hypothetical protein
MNPAPMRYEETALSIGAGLVILAAIVALGLRKWWRNR